MAAIIRIEARVRTGSKGTNGKLFAGIAGREFRLDKAGNDFRPNQDVIYTFGEGSDVRHADLNDPRNPQLETAQARALPKYIRFEPGNNADQVSIDVAQITTSSGTQQLHFSSFFLHDVSGTVNEVILGKDTGLFCYMRPAAATGTPIARIEARIRTEGVGGTNGFVYLGIAGREFRLNNGGNDFVPGSETIFTVGQNNSVKNRELNDPQFPRLRVDDLDTFPVYVRFEPRVDVDYWALDETSVTVNPADSPIRFNATMLEPLRPGQTRDFGLSLSQAEGKFCFLRRV
jgi:hypothetical protein